MVVILTFLNRGEKVCILKSEGVMGGRYSRRCWNLIFVGDTLLMPEEIPF